MPVRFLADADWRIAPGKSCQGDTLRSNRLSNDLAVLTDQPRDLCATTSLLQRSDPP